MASNGFDDFDGFGGNDDFGFGNDSSGGFDDFGGDAFGSKGDAFGNSGDAFGEPEDTFGGNDQQMNTNGDSQNMFSESVNQMNTQNQFQDATPSEQGGLKKQAIIFIVVGIIGVLLVFMIAGFIRSKQSKSSEQQPVINEQQQTNEQTQQNTDVNVDNVMNEENDEQAAQENSSNVITNKVDDDYVWTIITSDENVQFNEEYSDMTFTITNLEHKARVVDTNNNLVVVTTLQGSISGLSGTYELDIPYNKGVKLVVGNSFTVHVQLGTYNGKTVVGEIKY